MHASAKVEDRNAQIFGVVCQIVWLIQRHVKVTR